jgi:hypothetical protein
MRRSPHKRRRDGPPRPLELLLGDPGTVHAAAVAFELAERPEAAAWPIVAAVGPDTVTLRWAGVAATVPEPEAPWRTGHDARVWVAARDEIGVDGTVAVQTSASAVLVIGQFKDSMVFVNTSRAPGPIVVGGSPGGEAGLLRELVARQRRMMRPASLNGGDDPADGDDAGPRGAWWPVETEGDVVVLLGLAIARTFTADEVRLACELMERAMAQDPEHRRQPVAAGAEAEQTEVEQTDADEADADEADEHDKHGDSVKRAERHAELDDLEQVQAAAQTRQSGTGELAERLRKVKQASAQVEPEPEPELEPAQTSALRPLSPVAEPQTVGATVSVPEPAEPTVPAHKPTPDEVEPDDWAAEFAVSSRTGPNPPTDHLTV